MKHLVTFFGGPMKSWSIFYSPLLVGFIFALVVGSIGNAGEPTPKEAAVRSFLHRDQATSDYMFKNNFIVDSVRLYDLPYGAFLQAALGGSHQDQLVQITFKRTSSEEKFFHQCYLFTRSIERSKDGNPYHDKYEGFYLSNCMKEAKDLNTLN